MAEKPGCRGRVIGQGSGNCNKVFKVSKGMCRGGCIRNGALERDLTLFSVSVKILLYRNKQTYIYKKQIIPYSVVSLLLSAL